MKTRRFPLLIVLAVLTIVSTLALVAKPIQENQSVATDASSEALISQELSFAAVDVPVDNLQVMDISPQVLISPYLNADAISMPIDELRTLASTGIDSVLIGEPQSQQEYLVTKGQWLTYHGRNMSESLLPDRNTPVYVLQITGEFDHVFLDGTRPTAMILAVDVMERRVFAGALVKTLNALNTLDVNIKDPGYHQVPPEVMEAHQFRNTPEPDVEEQDLLPVPDAPTE